LHKGISKKRVMKEWAKESRTIISKNLLLTKRVRRKSMWINRRVNNLRRKNNSKKKLWKIVKVKNI